MATTDLDDTDDREDGRSVPNSIRSTSVTWQPPGPVPWTPWSKEGVRCECECRRLPTPGSALPLVLSVVVFGVVCELAGDDPYAPVFRYDPAPAPGRIEGPGDVAALAPDTAPTLRRFRGQFGSVGLEHLPRQQRRRDKYRERRSNQAGVSFTEFADLSDGRRAILRSDRGFSWSSSHCPDPWYGKTRESLAGEIRDYLAAEEEECCPITPESAVDLVQRYYDIEVDPESVEAALKLPRRIEFGARVLEELSRHEPST